MSDLGLVSGPDYSVEPFPVTYERTHPRATVRRCGDGRWRVAVWEAPGELQARDFSAVTTWSDGAEALEWAARKVYWDRKISGGVDDGR